MQLSNCSLTNHKLLVNLRYITFVDFDIHTLGDFHT